MRPIRLTVFAAVVTCASLSADAAVLPYRFEKVAQTGTSYTGLHAPSLNDVGVVAFQGTNAAGERGVYYGTPLGVQQVATPGLNVTANGVAAVGINGAGQVVFTALPPSNPNNFQGIDGVYRYNPGGVITTIAAPWSHADQISDGPLINDSGLVAFTIRGTADDLLIGDGSAPPVIRTRSFASLLSPHLNNAGQSVVIHFTPQRSIIFDNRTIISTTSPTYTDPDVGQPGTFFPYNADIGDGGRVVFSADFSGVAKALYVWQDDTITKVAGSNGLGEGAMPAINDLGKVAAVLAGNATAGTRDRLSLFKDGIEGTVIAAGDPFDGSTVTGLAFTPEGFNDLEQFAFTVTLADGRSVVVLATVPEPSGVGALLMVGALAMTRRRFPSSGTR